MLVLRLETLSRLAFGCAFPALLALALAGCGDGAVRSLGTGTTGPVVTGPPPVPTTPRIPAPPPVPIVSVRLTGTVTFDLVPFKPVSGMGLDLANPVVTPARNVTVEAIAEDDTTILASVRTNGAGGYTMTVPGSTRLHVRVKAEMIAVGPPSWTVRVRDNTSGDALYAIDLPLFDTGAVDSVHDFHAGSGWNTSSMAYDSPEARQAAPFALLDDVFRAQAMVLSADPMAVFPELNLFWSPNNKTVAGNVATGSIGTTYFDSTSLPAAIYVLGEADIDTDEFDSHVVLYQWGNYYQRAFSRLDAPGSGNPAAKLDARVAFSGGLSGAIGAMATADPVYRDSSGAQQGADLSFNIDTAPQTGWFNGIALSGLIYDIFDAPTVDDDGVALGFAPIHAAMTGAVKTTPAFVTIYPLLHSLLTDHAEVAAALKSLALARGVGDATGNVADDFGAAEIRNGGDARNLPVYNVITQGAPPVNVCSTDTNGVFTALGNRRFFEYVLAADGAITITATGAGAPAAPNPDVVVYRAGVEVGRGEAGGNESLLIPSLTAGTYVFEVYEAGNVRRGLPGVGTACIDVSVN